MMFARRENHEIVMATTIERRGARDKREMMFARRENHEIVMATTIERRGARDMREMMFARRKTHEIVMEKRTRILGALALVSTTAAAVSAWSS